MFNFCNFSVREFSDIVEPARSSDIDLKFLKKMVSALWEGSQKRVNRQVCKPLAVVLIDANSTPGKIVPYLGGPTASKVKFLFTGSRPLQHENKMELIQSVLMEAKKMYQFLPVFLSLGMNSVMKTVTSEDCRKLSGVLKVPMDDREGQVIR